MSETRDAQTLGTLRPGEIRLRPFNADFRHHLSFCCAIALGVTLCFSRDACEPSKTKTFKRSADKAGIPDLVLCRTVREAEQGLITVDLGGGVIKQRIARPGQGKSGGYRVPIVFRATGRAVFVYGFEEP
jgi:hypothetical protein